MNEEHTQGKRFTAYAECPVATSSYAPLSLLTASPLEENQNTCAAKGEDTDHSPSNMVGQCSSNSGEEKFLTRGVTRNLKTTPLAAGSSQWPHSPARSTASPSCLHQEEWERSPLFIPNPRGRGRERGRRRRSKSPAPAARRDRVLLLGVPALSRPGNPARAERPAWGSTETARATRARKMDGQSARTIRQKARAKQKARTEPVGHFNGSRLKRRPRRTSTHRRREDGGGGVHARAARG